MAEQPKYSASDIAKYFLSNTDEDEGHTISHFKLQKLLYYAQGFHLAIFERPLFSDDILAWAYGPVVESIFHQYNGFGPNPLPKDEGFNYLSIDKETRDLLDDVYNVYGQYSAWKLINMTHSEPPWKETPINGIIAHSKLKTFFETLVVDDEKEGK